MGAKIDLGNGGFALSFLLNSIQAQRRMINILRLLLLLLF